MYPWGEQHMKVAVELPKRCDISKITTNDIQGKAFEIEHSLVELAGEEDRRIILGALEPEAGQYIQRWRHV